MNKICTFCNESCPLSSFNKQKGGAQGVNARCRKCIKLIWLRDYGAGNSYARNSQYKRRYGISLDDYEIMYEEQEGRCGICSKKEDQLCVDHCHDTELVRGLLCRKCNLALGHFNDDLETIKKAEAWLDE